MTFTAFMIPLFYCATVERVVQTTERPSVWPGPTGHSSGSQYLPGVVLFLGHPSLPLPGVSHWERDVFTVILSQHRWSEGHLHFFF